MRCIKSTPDCWFGIITHLCLIYQYTDLQRFRACTKPPQMLVSQENHLIKTYFIPLLLLKLSRNEVCGDLLKLAGTYTDLPITSPLQSPTWSDLKKGNKHKILDPKPLNLNYIVYINQQNNKNKLNQSSLSTTPES